VSEQQTFAPSTCEAAIARVLTGFAAALNGASPAVVARELAGSVGNALAQWNDAEIEDATTRAAKKLQAKHDAGGIENARHAGHFLRKVFVSTVGAGAKGSAPAASSGGNGYGPRMGSGYCTACGSDGGRHERDCPIDAVRRQRLADAIGAQMEVSEMRKTCAPYFADAKRNMLVAVIEKWRAEGGPKPVWAFYQFDSEAAYIRSRRRELGLEPLPEVPAAIRRPDDAEVFGAADDGPDDWREGDPTVAAGLFQGVTPERLELTDVRHDDVEREEHAP
jgi:hypothetical protein